MGAASPNLMNREAAVTWPRALDHVKLNDSNEGTRLNCVMKYTRHDFY